MDRKDITIYYADAARSREEYRDVTFKIENSVLLIFNRSITYIIPFSNVRKIRIGEKQ